MARSRGNDRTYPLDAWYPRQLVPQLTISGRDFVDRLGVPAMRDITTQVLLGHNVRVHTEPLTQQRIAEVTGAIVTMFVNAAHALGAPVSGNLLEHAIAQFEVCNSGDRCHLWPAQWLLGVTGKGVQNVLRSKAGDWPRYREQFSGALSKASATLDGAVGAAEVKLNVGGQSWTCGWADFAHLLTAVGAAALAIRGSDKSRYGKLFEKLVLGSALSLCGFTFDPDARQTRAAGRFWFADKSDGRDCDARVVVKDGEVASLDIGFIGIGNPEIVRDKLTRFAKRVEANPQAREETSRTFVVVDRYSKHQRSNTLKLARDVGATLVEMSQKNWPRELARKFAERFDVRVPLADVPDDKIVAHIVAEMAKVDVARFIDVAELEEAEANDDD